MKVLFLVQKEQRAILDRLYEGVQAHCECDLRWLSREDQADLKGYFKREVDVLAMIESCSSCVSNRRFGRLALLPACLIW